MSNSRLTTTSFIVLGLVEQLKTATPYDLKRVAQLSVVNFWALSHTQLYVECDRLAGAGYLHEEREDHGRRRRLFRITDDGQAALEAWRAEPVADETTISDASLLKLFLGGDPQAIAREQLAPHRQALADYEGLAGEGGPPMTDGPRRALQAGIEIERAYLRFWESLLD